MQKRKLGYWESACALIHDELNATGLMFTRIQVEGGVSFDALTRCLKQLFLRHPLLRATIQHDEEYYYFELNAQLSDIPTDFYTFSKELEVETYIEEMLRTPLETSQYLWKVALFSNGNKHEIILFLHHSIADGLSSIELTDELLSLLSDKNNISQFESLPLLEPIEKLVNASVKHTGQNSNPVQASKIYYQKPAALENRVTKNMFTIIKSPELQKIKQYCKQHEITINSFINAAFILAMKNVFESLEVLAITTPVNLRSYITPQISAEQVGCYMTCFTISIALNKQALDFLTFAKEYQAQLKEATENLSRLPEELNLKNLQVVSGLVDIEHARTRDYFPAGVAVTNKGLAKLKRQYGSLKLLGYFTASSRQAGDLAVNLSLTTVEDEMYCCFTYVEPLMPHEIVAKLLKQFIISMAFLNGGKA